MVFALCPQVWQLTSVHAARLMDREAKTFLGPELGPESLRTALGLCRPVQRPRKRSLAWREALLTQISAQLWA